MGSLLCFFVLIGLWLKLSAVTKRLSILEKQLAHQVKKNELPLSLQAKETLETSPTKEKVSFIPLQSDLSSPVEEIATPSSIPLVPVQDSMEELPEDQQPIKEIEKSHPYVESELLAFFKRQNPIVIAGVIILTLGAGFFLKYAVTAGLLRVSLEMRHLLVGAGAAGLLWKGIKERQSRPDIAGAFCGGAHALGYITCLSAYSVFSLISSTTVSFLLLLLTFCFAWLGIILRSQALFLLAWGGGFLAPVVVKASAPSPILYLGYFLVLNLGALSSSVRCRWNLLPSISLAASTLMALWWAASYYTPHLFFPTEVFLVLFLLLFSLLPLVKAHLHREEVVTPHDILLIIGSLVTAIPLQQRMVSSLGWSALLAGGAYGGVSWWAGTFSYSKVLAVWYRGIGIILALLSLPFFLSTQWTGLSWSLCGAGIFLSGVTRGKRIEQLIGGATLFLSQGFLLSSMISTKDGFTPELFPALIVALSFLSCAFGAAVYSLNNKELASTEKLFLYWGLGWWYGGGIISFAALQETPLAAYLLWVASSAFFFEQLSEKLYWTRLRAHFSSALYAFPISGAFLLAVHFISEKWRWYTEGALYWILSLVLLGSILQGKNQKLLTKVYIWIFPYLFLFTAQLLALIPSMKATQPPAFQASVQFFSPFFLIIMCLCWEKLPKLLTAHQRNSFQYGAATIFLILFIQALLSVEREGSPLPFFNGDDGVLLITLISIGVLLWKERLLGMHHELSFPLLVAGALTVVTIHVLPARLIHHYTVIPYTAKAIVSSSIYQATISILWGVLGLFTVVFATRIQQRRVWIAGGSLLGLLVGKLFLIDLSQIGTGARIISFIFTGVVLLLVGYFSPIPPDEVENKTS